MVGLLYRESGGVRIFFGFRPSTQSPSVISSTSLYYVTVPLFYSEAVEFDLSRVYIILFICGFARNRRGVFGDDVFTIIIRFLLS